MSSPIWYIDAQEVDDYANRSGDNDWLGLSIDDKNFTLELSTSDIESLHGQPRKSGVPWMLSQLRDACKYQALFNARILSQRKGNYRTNAVTEGSYNDGVLSITPKKSIDYDNRSFILTGEIMRQNDIFTSSQVWHRG